MRGMRPFQGDSSGLATYRRSAGRSCLVREDQGRTGAYAAQGPDAIGPSIAWERTADATTEDRSTSSHAAAAAPSMGSAPIAQEILTGSLDGLEAQLEELAAVDLQELGAGTCEAAYGRVEQSIRRLKAFQTLLYATTRQRRVEFVEHVRPEDARAGDKARRKLVDDLQQRNRQTPSEVNQIDRTAQHLDTSRTPTRQAFLDGEITARHVQLIGDTIGGIDEDKARDVEPRLLALARQMNAHQFYKECQRLLAEVNYSKAVDDQRARHQRRSLRMKTGDDGMLYISGRLAGIDAETVATAIHQFRKPDPAKTPADERRTPDQATADGFAAMCSHALRHAETTKHGHPPQVIITIDYEAVLRQAGVAETAYTGPLPFDEVRRLLADAGVGRIVTDARGVPVEAGESVRTVPQGLWRALIVRDGGCVADGCTVPAGWCDIAHLHKPFRLKGRLSVQNAAMACRRHHRNFDLDGWKVTWIEERPIIHHPARPPGRARDPVAPGSQTSTSPPGSQIPPGSQERPGSSRQPGPPSRQPDPPSRPPGPSSRSPGPPGAAGELGSSGSGYQEQLALPE